MQLVFSGAIEPTRLSWPYRLGLVVVAIAMLLLPLVYLGVIVGAAAVVWWHLTANTWLLERGAGQIQLIAYLAPLVIGVAVVFFLIKPVLARPAKRPDPVLIAPEREPDLIAFVEAICSQVRAPVPRRVQIDCKVNASAGFLPGRFSLLKPDLVLTIGLPLVAGLSKRELGGVLAHEFGHFAQGGGLRLTAVVRGVNHWFARVVYERDDWDGKLERWSQIRDMRIALVLRTASGAVWLSRRLLYGLMMAGHAISCFMMREMEYDADSYQIKFGGSDAFVRTFGGVRQLSVGAQLAYQDLQQAWVQRTLPMDFPTFVVERTARMPEELVTQVLQFAEAKPGLFATHPADADRVRAAQTAAADGILVGGDESATELFRDFDAISMEATRHHYAHDLGLALDAVALVDREAVVQGTSRREQGQEAIATLFGDRISIRRPLRLPIEGALRLADADRRTALVTAQNDMATLGSEVASHYRRIEELAVTRTKAFAGEELLNAGISLSEPAAFGLAEGTLAGAAAAQKFIVEQQQREASSLEGFEIAAGRRLALGIAFASQASPSVAIESIGQLFNAVAGSLPHAHDANRFVAAVAVLARFAENPKVSKAVRTRIQLLGSKVDQCFDRIREVLGDLPCPPELTNTPMTAVAWCRLDPGPVTARPQEVIERVMTLYWMLLGHLATIGLMGEP